jgi:hypothetical protein
MDGSESQLPQVEEKPVANFSNVPDVENLGHSPLALAAVS